MVIEEELNLRIENKKQEFASFLREHRSVQEQRQSEYDGWLSQEREVEEKLKKTLQEIREARFLSRLNIMINDNKGAATASRSVDFSKLAYFISRLNGVNTPEYVFKKNPDYCKTVLQTIASEYLGVLAHLRNLKENKEREKTNADNQTFFSAQAKIKQAWEDFCARGIDELAREKANALIKECEDAVLG